MTEENQMLYVVKHRDIVFNHINAIGSINCLDWCLLCFHRVLVTGMISSAHLVGNAANQKANQNGHTDGGAYQCSSGDATAMAMA